MIIRKTVFMKETIEAEPSGPDVPVICRVAAIAVLDNPFSGQYVEDLSLLYGIALTVGEKLMPQAVAMLEKQPRSYGKAAIVGVNGDIEHGAAALHPTLGKPMRAAVGGGESIIPHTAKIGSVGAQIDVPLGNKDDIWSFNDLDTISVTVSDAPRPDEFVLVMAIADGGRANPRIGSGHAAK